MSDASDPTEIYDRAKAEGRRRLGMPPPEQPAGEFIAGWRSASSITWSCRRPTCFPDGGSGERSRRSTWGVGLVIAGSGNLIGGILLTTLTHAVQVIDARRRA